MANDPKTPPKPDWALTGRERKAEQAKSEGRRPPRRRWPWVLLAILLIAGGGFYAQSNGMLGDLPEAQEAAASEPQGEEQAEAAPREVVMQLLPRELTEIAPQTLSETVRITGSLDPVRQLGIPAEVSGRIDFVGKRAGDAAEAGEELVRIDIATLRNQLEQSRATADATRAQLTFAEAQLSRTRSLVDRGISTSSNLDSDMANVQQLRANLDALEQQVSTAERSLEKASISAPFDGIISDRSVDPGTYVNPGAALLTLVDISSLELEGAVPVVYAPRIQTGQTVTVTIDGLDGHSFSGTVERIAPVAAAGTRMLPIYATFENTDGNLRGGMFASGQLVLEQKPDAIGVPVDALREDDGGTYVLKREGDRVVRQDVTVARTWDRGRIIEVSEGLAEGDVIVSAPLERLQPDTRITVVEG